MANAPLITFRGVSSPYNLISGTLIYSQTLAIESGLPVLSTHSGAPLESSDVMGLRIYNNFGTPPSSAIATAYNFVLTTYDSASILTASTPPVSNMWIYFQEVAYGEQSSIPGLKTTYLGQAQAVGGPSSVMTPEVGTDNTSLSKIRAGASQNGVGFIEVNTYALVPSNQSANTWNFAVGATYNWNT